MYKLTHLSMSEPISYLQTDATLSRRSAWSLRLGLLVADRGALAGLLIIACIALVALLAPWIAVDPTEQSITQAFAPPSSTHWFGTDEFGRDVLSRVIYGTRPALYVGILSVLVSILLGMPLGILAGYRGGWIDTAVSGFVDIMLSFPSLLLALMVIEFVANAELTPKRVATKPTAK